MGNELDQPGNQVWLDREHLCFTNAYGAQISKNTLAGEYNRLLRQAALPYRRFHDLRHTFATHLLARGVNVKLVSEWLGHSTPVTTMNTYSHFIPSMEREATDALTKAFG